MAKTNAQLQEELDGLQKQLVEASEKIAELEAAATDAAGSDGEKVAELEAKVAELETAKAEADAKVSELEAGQANAKVKKEVVTLSDHELIEVEFRGGRGSVYHSIDPWNGDAPISLQPGDSARVSPRKAKQLAEDFPNDFQVDGNGPERGDKVFVAQVFEDEDDDN